MQGMLELDEVTRIATEVAKSILPPGSLVRVESALALDPDWRDALQFTMVIAAELADQVTGDHAVAFLDQIWDRLQDAGDDRVPTIEYTTEAELAEIDDP